MSGPELERLLFTRLLRQHAAVSEAIRGLLLLAHGVTERQQIALDEVLELLAVQKNATFQLLHEELSWERLPDLHKEFMAQGTGIKGFDDRHRTPWSHPFQEPNPPPKATDKSISRRILVRLEALKKANAAPPGEPE